MEGSDHYLNHNLRLFSTPSMGYRSDGVVAVGSSRWTWMGLGFIAILSSCRCRVKGFHLGFSGRGKHAQGSYVEAVASACLQLKRLVFIIQNSSSMSVAKSVGPSTSTYGPNKLESPTSEQQLDCLTRNLIRLPRHENICPAGRSESRSRSRCIKEPMQDRRGKITFSSDIVYDMGWKEKCKGSLFIMNNGEGGGRQLGPCLSHSCVDLGVWRRVESFETQYGWDRLQSLRLGYDWDWNFYTGRSVLNLDKLAIYPMCYINIPNEPLDSPTTSLVKLFSLREDDVTSVDMAWDMGLSCISTIDNTVRLWDVEVGKPLNKLMVDDYAIVGSHIGDHNPVFILSGIMMREEKGSLFVWDRRDFQRPLNFCVGNISTSQSVDFKENKVYVSDCLNEKQFDIRMINQQQPIYGEENSFLYCH